MTALQLESLQVQQGAFSLEVAQWQARTAQFHALLGPNGAGKTTLLRTIAGELPYQGHVLLHGKDLRDWNPLQRARHLAVLPQASQLSFGFTAAEVVALGATPLSLAQRELRAEVRRVMALTDCAGLAAQLYPGLSGGEKQRVHLARVLLQLSQASDQPVLLLDEPTSAQDLGQQHTVLGQVRRLCLEQGYAAVAVLHDLNQALRYAQYCSLVDSGRVVAAGAPDGVITPLSVQQYWGYAAEPVTTSKGLPQLL
ncbi:MAG: ATP-binding cassette domain-containing protein [Pseudomonadota bacterium]